MSVRNPLSQAPGEIVLERPLPGWLGLITAASDFRLGSCPDAGQSE
jgi:hypothetical protein